MGWSVVHSKHGSSKIFIIQHSLLLYLNMLYSLFILIVVLNIICITKRLQNSI